MVSYVGSARVLRACYLLLIIRVASSTFSLVFWMKFFHPSKESITIKTLLNSFSKEKVS